MTDYINSQIRIKLPLTESNLNYDYGAYGPENLESYEFMDSKYWANPKDISSPTLRNLSHPIWFIGAQYVRDNFIPKHSILHITDNPNYTSNEEDVLYNLQLLIPPEYKHIYPFSHCKWDRTQSSEFIDKCYKQKRCGNILIFLLNFPYDKVIVDASKEEIDYLKFYISNLEENIQEDPILKKVEPQKGIAITPECSEEDIGWDHSTPITDDELKTYWGTKLTSGGREKPLYKSEFREKALTQDPKDACEELMSKFVEGAYQGHMLRPIQKEKELLIKREYLPAIKELQGEDLGILGHPLWWFTTQLTLEHFKPTSDTMTLCSCSNSKPYKDNINYWFIRQRIEEGYTDAFVTSLDIWPLMMSDQNYNRIYDWSHLKETPLTTEILLNYNVAKVLWYYKHFNYKKCIFWAPPTNPLKPQEKSSYTEMIDRIKKYIPELEVVMDEDTTYTLMKYNNNSFGIVKTRFYNFLTSRQRYDKLLNYHGDHPTPVLTPEEEAEIKRKRKEARERNKINKEAKKNMQLLF